jgi:hypothetical protein
MDLDKAEILTGVNMGDDSGAIAQPMDVTARAYTGAEIAKLGDGIAVMGNAASMDYVVDGIEMVKVGEATNAVVGGTNAAAGQVRKIGDETIAADGEVTIELTEDEITANGVITVAYDPDVLTYVDTLSEVEIFSVNEADGTICFAYASTEDIEAGKVLATVKFTYEAEEVDTEVTVNTLERNDDLAVEDDALIIPIKVEASEPVEFLLGNYLKDGDQVVIYNPAADKALSNEMIKTYYRAGKDIDPEDGKVIDPAADLVWNVTEVEGGFELADAEGHKLTIGEKNSLPVDDVHATWKVEKDASGIYLVNVTAPAGKSGDPKAIEWYNDDFTAYYLTKGSDAFILELYIKDFVPMAHEHEYGAPVWTWNEDLTEATAKFTCIENDDEQTLNAEITEAVTKEAAPHVAGEKTLTAKVTFNGTEYTDTKTVVIEALPCPCAAFEDMPEYGTPEHEAIDWAFTNEITKGMDATHFGTEATLTRGQAATFLYAAAGKPEFDETTASKSFTDVPAGQWFTKPVLWAAENGLVAGYSDGTFKPNATLTRAQILVILYAKEGKPEITIENPYTDVPENQWFTDPALWAYQAGIERGEDGKFAQATPCTRAAFVLYLYREMTGNCLLGD